MLRRLFLFTLFLCAILGISSFASAASPYNNQPTGTLNPDYCAHQATGTATYLLNKALTGTASATVDLGLVGCFFLNVTSTGGANLRVWWTSNSTSYTAGTTVSAGTFTSYAIPGGPNQIGCYAIPKIARYLYVDTPPSIGVPFAAGGTTPTAITTSCWYYLPTNWPY